jgi:membrane protease YdiL (CAAX protease family)
MTSALFALRSDSLLLPLAFSFLVIAAAILGRFVLDLGVAPSPNGTSGKLLWILAPLLLAWLARRLDPVTRHAALFRLDRTVWHCVALVSISTIVALLAMLYAGVYFQMTNFLLRPFPFQTYAFSFASICMFALIEESAWRGYLLPALLARVSYPVALAFGAAICFCWHLPYLDQLAAVYTDETLYTLAPRVFIGLLAMQWLCAELFLRSRSVWPAVALHATFNVFASLAFISGLRLVDDGAWLLSPSVDGAGVIAMMAGCAYGLCLRRCS